MGGLTSGIGHGFFGALLKVAKTEGDKWMELLFKISMSRLLEGVAVLF